LKKEGWSGLDIRNANNGAPPEKKKKLSACRGEGSVVGPLLAARALLLRCAAGAVLSSTLANCGARAAPSV
jgi:hypothetical protein